MATSLQKFTSSFCHGDSYINFIDEWILAIDLFVVHVVPQEINEEDKIGRMLFGEWRNFPSTQTHGLGN